jgi:hypothetical protein
MAEHNWVINWPTMVSSPLMKIAPADAYCGYLYKNIISANNWTLDLTELDVMRLRSIIDYPKRSH